MTRLTPVLVAFCVLGGSVFAEFMAHAAPLSFLVRPLGAALLVALIVGTISIPAGRYAAIAAALASLLLVRPVSWLSISLAALFAAIVMGSIRGFRWDTSRAVAAAAAVFFLVGAVRVLSTASWTGGPLSRSPDDGRVIYVVLMDGYPRADTLADLGVDITRFIGRLEDRGFVHYPQAESRYGWTHLTLAAMLAGAEPQADRLGTAAQRRVIRSQLRLPDGFVAISPPAGHVTIPGVKHVGPSGINTFEISLLGRSAVGSLTGDVIMDSIRHHLARSLDALATTDHSRVFAHLLAPHTPFLYDGDRPLPPPTCWPGCNFFDITVEDLGITVEEWADGISGYLEYLNRRIVETVDAILERRPKAVIVLFSDHGGRYTAADTAEWHRTFLAARGVTFEEPHPRTVFQALGL